MTNLFPFRTQEKWKYKNSKGHIRKIIVFKSIPLLVSEKKIDIKVETLVRDKKS